MNNSKYLILRRFVQLSILFLFFAGANFGISILKGNLSTANVFDKLILSDPYAVLQMAFTGYFPTIEIIIGAVIVLVFYALIGGRIFCSWVCPLNIVTDFASYLRRRFKIIPVIKPNVISRKIRYYVIGLGLILSFITGVAAFEIINPISILFRGIILGTVFSLTAILIVFLFDLFIISHGWCGHICPVGAVYAATGKFRLLKIYHTSENCTKCMKCKVVCPEVQVMDIIGRETGKINSSECTDCARCIDVCNDNALKFKIK